MTDAEQFYARRWEDFQHLTSLIDHWYWRPGWKVGRSFYTWHLTFGQDDPVHKLARIYQERIQFPFLDPVPPQGLHLTIQGIGFTDEVSAGDLASILDATETLCRNIAPFDLTLGPADADEQGVPLSVRPHGPITELRSTLRSGIAAVWGQDAVPESADGFHPHVTMFYSNSQVDPTPLRHLLAAMRDTPSVITRVEGVSLIRLNRDRKVYEWDTVASVALGHR